MIPTVSVVLKRCCVCLLVLGLATPALATPVDVTHTDLLHCDPLFVPQQVDELGLGPASAGPFPPDEEISAFDVTTSLVACPSADMPAVPNVLVVMTNLTTRDFDEVWYVADPETGLSNFDGLVNSELAFRIDSSASDPGGINHPLVMETMIANDIFQAGETWEFIIDDYSNALGLPASAFLSPFAVGFMSPGGPSSGSIIAIPEPATLLLLVIGGLALTKRPRRALT